MASSSPHPRPSSVKAIIFDLMGTCTNWYASIVPALEAAPSIPTLPQSDIPQFALDWRAGFFHEVKTRFDAGQAVEDIDVTHRRVLARLLLAKGVTPVQWNDTVRNTLVAAWHDQRGWADVMPALERLRSKYIIIVLANGSTRLQLDIAKSSNLPFHSYFSSELIGKAKPDPTIYRKTLSLLKLEPHEAIMVASHAYDLRGAKKAGLTTMYIHRTTEDLDENIEQVKKEVNFFFDGLQGGDDCGMSNMADVLGV